MATFAAVLGPLSFGFVLGYSSPAIPELCRIQDPRLQLSTDEASWFGVCECFWSVFFFLLNVILFLNYYYQLQCGCTVKEMLVIFSSQNLHFHCSARAGGCLKKNQNPNVIVSVLTFDCQKWVQMF